jgi:hypothetical protein
MKTIFAVLSLLMMSSANAVEFPPVADLCSGPRCTDAMRAVVTDYENASTFWAPEDLPQVASGSCYHIHANLDPNHEHHGMFLFDVFDGQPGFNGVFSFFAETNPYEGITVEQARTRLYGGEAPRLTPLIFENGQGLGLIPSATAKFYYWFKVNSETRELYLLSLWAFNEGGSSQRAFCRFHY